MADRFDWDILLEKAPDIPPVKRESEEPKKEIEAAPPAEKQPKPQKPAALEPSEEERPFKNQAPYQVKVRKDAPQKNTAGEAAESQNVKNNSRPVHPLQNLSSDALVQAFMLSEVFAPRGRWYRRRTIGARTKY